MSKENKTERETQKSQEKANVSTTKKKTNVMKSEKQNDKKKSSNKKQESGFSSKTCYHMVDPKDFEGEPFEIDGRIVKVLKLNKKRPSEMMGIDISSIGEANIDATMEMLQRSCEPGLSFEDCNNLDLPNILEAAGVFKTFFMGTQSLMSES